MIRRWPYWLIVAALGTMTALFPLRLALAMAGAGQSGISASAVGGTIWHGEAHEVSIGPLPVGHLETRLSPLRLLTGKAHVAFARLPGDPNGPLTGAIESGFGTWRLNEISGATGPLVDMAVPIESITLDRLSVRFDDGRCVSASGSVRLSIAINIAGMGLRHGLGGAATCRGDDMALTMTGDSGMERLTILIGADRSYDAQLSIRASDPLIAAALAGAGLAPQGDGFGYRYRGRY